MCKTGVALIHEFLFVSFFALKICDSVNLHQCHVKTFIQIICHVYIGIHHDK